jgi:diacylglycerol kinase family enzyme
MVSPVAAPPLHRPAASNRQAERAGAGLAILVNANAKRGGRRIAAELRRRLPAAKVGLTHRVEEIDRWLLSLKDEGPLRALFAAGGDGTVVTMLESMFRVFEASELPLVGALPLGTGNAWAHVLGAEKLNACVEALAGWEGPLPRRRYSLLRCEGRLAFFAGSGWDAQVLDDYRAQLAQSRGPLKRLNKSVYGYLSAMLLRTAPRSMILGNPEVTITNLGEKVYMLDAHARPYLAPGLGPGSVLYQGPVSVVGCATCPEFGFRFKAAPFADRLPTWMNVRVYATSPARAIAAIPQLWRGAHPMPGITDWYAKALRMTFSRPTPLQIAGEAVGARQEVYFEAFPNELDVVDFRGLTRENRVRASIRPPHGDATTEE